MESIDEEGERPAQNLVAKCNKMRLSLYGNFSHERSVLIVLLMNTGCDVYDIILCEILHWADGNDKK